MGLTAAVFREWDGFLCVSDTALLQPCLHECINLCLFRSDFKGFSQTLHQQCSPLSVALLGTANAAWELCRFLLEYISVECYLQKCMFYTIFLPQVSDLYESGFPCPPLSWGLIKQKRAQTDIPPLLGFKALQGRRRVKASAAVEQLGGRGQK